MKNYLLLKYLIAFITEYIFIFLTTTIFLFGACGKSFSDENVFVVDNVKVEGKVDLNFSREKYLNQAFLNSFEILMSKILLSEDLNKISNIKLKKIKKLVSSFQILDEKYSKSEYEGTFKILYNDIKVKKFLGEKNISFSQPEKITAIFYPLLLIDNEIKSFDENFFYENWTKLLIKNELINFVLPIEDLDDISEIAKMKDRIEQLNFDNFVNKYDITNYVFALMSYNNKKLKIHLKTNFNNNKISKNISYNIKNFNNDSELSSVLKNLKLKITDIWKEENLINILMPLSIKIKFQHSDLENLSELRNTFHKISIIDNYVLEEFDIKNSFFKIYYYGEPKKLKSELFKFGYNLKNDQGSWQLYINE